MRLYKAGFRVYITELPEPMVVRRAVSFAEAVFRGELTVEGISARLAEDRGEASVLAERGIIPVLVDPMLDCLEEINPAVVVDARMMKRSPQTGLNLAPLVIGLGPGFVAGEHCHAVVETNRGHYLGRVYWEGAAEADTGIPGRVGTRQAERVLRAPCSGLLETLCEIGDRVKAEDVVADVEGAPVKAVFDGLVRGLMHAGIHVQDGQKIGDIDPRMEREYCFTISEKALAIGGAVLEAVLSRMDLKSAELLTE
jgi:xanthine dehydrogenase accessory factor